MTSSAVKEWPPSLREHGLVALDVDQTPVDRCTALQRLGEAVGCEFDVTESQRKEILSLAASLVAAVDQIEVIELAATTMLAPVIELCARIVGGLFKGQHTDEMKAGALGLIWELIKRGKFKHGKNFEQWCRTVLTNDLISRYRKKKDAMTHWKAGENQSDAMTEVPERVHGVEIQDFMGTDFSDIDLERLGDLPLRNRLGLLAISNLWRKVPDDLWQQWVEDYDVELPFPPEGFLELTTQQERASSIGAALGMTQGAITQVWHRLKTVLLRLDCLQQAGLTNWNVESD